MPSSSRQPDRERLGSQRRLLWAELADGPLILGSPEQILEAILAAAGAPIVIPASPPRERRAALDAAAAEVARLRQAASDRAWGEAHPGFRLADLMTDEIAIVLFKSKHYTFIEGELPETWPSDRPPLFLARGQMGDGQMPPRGAAVVWPNPLGLLRNLKAAGVCEWGVMQ